MEAQFLNQPSSLRCTSFRACPSDDPPRRCGIL